MFNVKPVWEMLCTWLSLVMSLMVSFFHEMSWMRSGTESVPENFPTYSLISA